MNTIQNKWTVDLAHSNVSFKVQHLLISNVRGGFINFDANVYTTGNDFSTAQVDAYIGVASIYTGDAKRDEHLISKDFFNADAHKQISFTSNNIDTVDEDGNYAIWGTLTIKDVSKKMKFDVRFGGLSTQLDGTVIAGFSVAASISRAEYGLLWNKAIETGGILVGDIVHLTADFELHRTDVKNLEMKLENETVIKSVAY